MKDFRAAALGILLFAPYEGTESAATLLPRVDVTAILRSWRIKGALSCFHRGSPRVCLWVENAFPCGLLEVVRRPFTSHLAEANAVTRAASGLDQMLTSTGGSDAGAGNLQFADTRVFSFIPTLPEDLGLPLAAPRGSRFRFHYISELDAWGWRTGLMDRVRFPVQSLARCDLSPSPRTCAGRWGAYFPREGFLVHPSEVVSSFLFALRAGRVASDPGGRFVPSRYPFEPRTGHYIQMVRPVLRPAVRIGSSAPLEWGAGSLSGAYLFVHLAIFEGCSGCLPARLVGER